MVTGRDLIRDAADKANLQAAARVDIDHSHLFSHAHRLAPIGDRVAENEQPSLFRLAGKDAHNNRAGRVEICRRLMMLVDHELEAQVLGNHPLVDIAVVEIGPELRIVITIRERNPDRVILLGIGQQVIGVLTEMPGAHAQASLHDR
jgi:hypothetical protein